MMITRSTRGRRRGPVAATRSLARIVAAVATVAIAAGDAGADEREPFTQAIDGTVVSFEMVPVSGGTVTIDDTEVVVEPFWIGRTELTWDAFDVYLFGLDRPGGTAGGADATARPSKPYISMDRGFGHAGYPAISMSYHSAKSFCDWLSAKTGRRYRLPTEAEWRLACQASLADSGLDDLAWFFENAKFKTHPVAAKRANGLGVHDMLGNAAEWVTGHDGRPVTMGGNYRTKRDEIACGLRVEPVPAWNASDPQLPKSVWWLADAGFVGFRLVCEPAPDQASTEQR